MHFRCSFHFIRFRFTFVFAPWCWSDFPFRCSHHIFGVCVCVPWLRFSLMQLTLLLTERMSNIPIFISWQIHAPLQKDRKSLFSFFSSLPRFLFLYHRFYFLKYNRSIFATKSSINYQKYYIKYTETIVFSLLLLTNEVHTQQSFYSWIKCFDDYRYFRCYYSWIF